MCLGCREKERLYQQRRRSAIPHYHNNHQKAYNQRLKKQILLAYGRTCACCSEDNPVFLCIDHIEGGGNQHKRLLFGRYPSGGYRFYQWLKREGFPSGFRVLCWNCNHGMRMGGCPHAAVS